MDESDPPSKCQGVMYAILSGLSFTVFNCFFKMIKSLSIFEVILIHRMVQALLVLPVLVSLRLDPRGPEGTRLLVWFGAVLGSLDLYLQFTSVSILPFGDSLAIKFSSPVIVMLLSHCFLKELCGIYKMLMVVLLLIGITLITKPPGLIHLFSTGEDTIKSSLPIYGYIAAFSALFGFSLTTLVRKKLSDKVHFSVIIFSCSMVSIPGCLVAIPLVSSFSIPSNWTDFIYGILVGVFCASGIMFAMLAFRRLPAGMVSILRSMEIAMAYLIGILMFNDPPDIASLIGASAVMLSVIFITQEEIVMEFIVKYVVPSRNSESLPLVNEQDEEQENKLTRK